MEPPARPPTVIRHRLLLSLAVCAVFGAIEAGALAPARALVASNLLQLALAIWAAVACARAAGRERRLGRWFLGLFGLGMAIWATAQTILTLTGAGPRPRALVAVESILYLGCIAPLVAACALRPHRPKPGALGLAADVGLVCLLVLFMQAYFGAFGQASGEPDPSPDNPLFFNPQRLMLLGGLLWLMHRSAGAWRRLYDQLALAMIVYLALGMIPNLALAAGIYEPGLLDLPWALPFLWVALAAGEWQPQADDADARQPSDLAGWQPADWQEARRSSALALGSVVLVPVVHQIAIAAGSYPPALEALRGRLALFGTLAIGGLYLLRQLQSLRSVAATQRAREERFRALVENSADAIGVLDAEQRFSYVSASSERVTGYAPDDLLGRSPFELADPEDAPALRRALSEVASHPGGSARGFVRYRHQDGTLRHGEIEVENHLATQAVAGIVLHLRDVTEQRQAAEQRERSLSLLEATLESTADGILVTSNDGRIERTNQKFSAMWHVPPDVLSTRDEATGLAFVVGQLQDPDAFLERLQALYAEPAAEAFDTLRFRDGRVFERWSLPQRLAGEIVGRVFSFRDVSERAHAEAAMARLVAVIEATPDLVATCDAALRPLYLNRAGRAMLGIGEGQPLPDGQIAEFHPGGARERLLEEAVPAALREGAWSGETRLRHRDGRELPVLQVLLAHRSPDGEVDFFSTIARDISQRLEAEQELRRSHTMAALGSLVSGVAHEVRNPLFGISATLDAFETRFLGRVDHARYVRALRDQLDRLTGLMNDLLEYAKPRRLELRTGSLERVAARAVAACAAMQQRTGSRIEARIAPDLPPIRMDEGRLVQVFQNLLANAIQHSPPGGQIRIAARLLPVVGGRVVEASVEDDGPGFRPSDLPHLFEPFFTRRKGGTGLGLSIVQRILADHGGSIAASNRPEGGARFTVTLPLEAAS